MDVAPHLALGLAGEEIAAAALEGEGYEILARGYRTPVGELDIIARDGACLVFVEVKTRRDLTCGHPAEAVTWRKRRKLVAMAEDYLSRHRTDARECRFDVVAIVLADEDASIEIIRHAFDAV